MDKKELRAQTRSRWSWYLYDFGNSAYASIILLAVYSVYFKDVIVGDNAAGTRLWGISVGIAAILVALVSPILGAIADSTKFKKGFLIIFTALSVVFTALLFFVRAGDIYMGMIFFILAEIGYRAAQVFYDALLTDISTSENIGEISGKGWAVGMVGGIIALVVVLVPMLALDNFNISYAFLITAVFYAISSLPTILWVKEKGSEQQTPHEKGVIVGAFKQLAETFREIRSFKEFVKYMIAFLVYNDGIMMIMDFAAIIGATLFGLESIMLILFVILIQISGAVGALFFGKMADKVSSRAATLYSLIILTISMCGLFFVWSAPQIFAVELFADVVLTSNQLWFIIIGFIAGFALSGAQAVSRSMVVQLAPDENVTEFYGFLSVAGRTSTFVGPLVFGTLQFRTNNWYVKNGVDTMLAAKYGVLWGIGSIIAFLVIGSLLLLLVKSAYINNPVKKKEKS